MAALALLEPVCVRLVYLSGSHIEAPYIQRTGLPREFENSSPTRRKLLATLGAYGQTERYPSV